MPYYYRRGYYPRRRKWRPRRTWFRSNFRRRRYRRHWVSNPLNKITLKQWQPPFKKTCYIKGETCLIYYNNDRLGQNSVMYEKSIVPDHWPGGGSFTVLKYTLDTLYDMHKECRNWWTGSNADLPLVKYHGCTLKIYQPKYTDAIIRVFNILPAVSNKLTYPGTHPNMMLMTANKHIIPSRETRKKRKPYTTIKVPPPPQFENKWYFATDILKIPLLTIHATAANLTNPYIKPQNNSHNTTFMGLNTASIQNKNFATKVDYWPFKYVGTVAYYFYLDTGDQQVESSNIDIRHLVPLTNPIINTPGTAFLDMVSNRPTWSEYIKNWKKYAGNPFHKEQEQHLEHLYFSIRSPQTIITNTQSKDGNSPIKWSDIQDGTQTQPLTPFNEPIFVPFQYNPDRDTGEDTEAYLVKNYEGHGWDNPQIPEITLSGFPMWLLLWGYVDFQKHLKKAINIDTTYILVIKSKFTQRPREYPIVPINNSFIQGNSPYEKKPLPEDEIRWYPMVQYQTEEQNKILATGPFTPNILNLQSDNICAFYKYKFTWGGSPPKHIDIEDPSHQIQYPIPSTEYETTSLQNPGTAPESLLYSFDFRHGNLTTTALSRITKDWPIKETLSSITEPTQRQLLQQAIQHLQESEQNQEKKEKETQILLNQLREQQQCYRQQIIQLLKNQ
nr:MAG: ORF1 [TTV-like mini virus]